MRSAEHAATYYRTYNMQPAELYSGLWLLNYDEVYVFVMLPVPFYRVFSYGLLSEVSLDGCSHHAINPKL